MTEREAMSDERVNADALILRAERWADACDDPCNFADGIAGPQMGSFLRQLAAELKRTREALREAISLTPPEWPNPDYERRLARLRRARRPRSGRRR